MILLLLDPFLLGLLGSQFGLFLVCVVLVRGLYAVACGLTGDVLLLGLLQGKSDLFGLSLSLDSFLFLSELLIASSLRFSLFCDVIEGRLQSCFGNFINFGLVEVFATTDMDLADVDQSIVAVTLSSLASLTFPYFALVGTGLAGFGKDLFIHGV